MIKKRKQLLRMVALLGVAALTASSGLAGPANAVTKEKAKAKAKPKTKPTTKPKPTVAPTPTAAPAAAASGSVAKFTEIQNGAEPSSWDPTKNRSSAGAEGNRLYPIFGVLFTMDPKTKAFRPLLADSLTTTDGVNWTMKLHKGVTFTDGTPFDAAAVKLNWERHKDATNASASRAFALQLVSVNVVNPLTLTMTLAARNQQLVWGMQRSLLNYIASPTALAAGNFATNPVGAGPFKLKDYKREDRTVFTANPAWPFWPGGKPNIEELIIKPVIDENQRFNNIATKQADLVFTQFAQITVKAKKEGFGTTYTAQEGGNTIIFNTTKPPFNDQRMRVAMQLAIDFKAFKAVNSPGDENPITNVFDDDSPFVDKGNNFPKFDLEEAQKNIDAYVRDNGGKQVEITLSHFTSTANALNAAFFQASWSKLKNVKVTLDPADSAAAQGKVIRGLFSVSLWGNLWTDPDEIYDALLSTSPQNWGRWGSPVADVALNQGRNATTVAERKAAYSNLFKIVNFDVPLIFYDRVPTNWIHDKKTTNFVWFNDGILLIDQLKFS